MSRENVEIVRRAYEAANRGDVETIISLSHREVVSIPLRSSTEGTFRGHDGIRQYFHDTAEAFEAFGFDIREFRDLGQDRVLVVGEVRVRGRGSGVTARSPSASLVWLRDGKVIRLEDFGSPDRALEAVGLRE